MAAGRTATATVLAAALLATPALAPAGAANYVVDVYKPDKVYPGTTIFTDSSDLDHSKIVEVDMTGKVLWSYAIPSSAGKNTLTDVEWVPNHDSILFGRENGVYEVDRSGKIIWSCKGHASHDVDRLPNGNTLVVWFLGHEYSEPDVRELDPDCHVVWEWHADRHLDGETRINDQEGLTHTNSAIRLANGNTIVSLRNYYLLVEVNPAGEIVWKLPGLFTTPHDPEILANGDILVNTREPEVIKEFTPAGRVVWAYMPNQHDVQTVRYNHKLPNGNILFVERTKIIEVTPQKEVVWQLRLPGLRIDGDYRLSWLYKAERIPPGHKPGPVPVFAAPSETLGKSGEVALTLKQQLKINVAHQVKLFFHTLDKNHDGRVSAAEYGDHRHFAEMDTDGDGFITQPEERAYQAKRLMSTAGRPLSTGKGDVGGGILSGN